MKKLLSIFLSAIMLFALASCEADSAGYSALEMPMKGLCWGMSLEEVEKTLDEQKVSYTRKIEVDELGDSFITLTIEPKWKLYGFELETGVLHLDKTDGLRRVGGSFKESDKEKVVNAVAKEVGEFQKNEALETMGIEQWTAPVEGSLNSLKNDKLTKEAEKLYQEYYKPSAEEDEFEAASPDELLKDLLESPFVYVEINGGEVGSDVVGIMVDGSTAATVYQLDSLGAEGYYNKLLENKE